MITLKWRKDGDDWVAEGDGGHEILWRAEKVWSPSPKGYGWYVSGLVDGGYFDSLSMAKHYCTRETGGQLERVLGVIR